MGVDWPDCDGGESMAGCCCWVCWCWCCYRKESDPTLFFAMWTYPGTLVQYTTVSAGLTGHCLQAGKDLDRRPVGRPEQSVNPSIGKTRQKTVGRYSSSASAGVRGYLDYRHISNCDTGTTVIHSVPYLPSACGGGKKGSEQGQVRSCPAIPPCHAMPCPACISTSLLLYYGTFLPSSLKGGLAR